MASSVDQKYENNLLRGGWKGEGEGETKKICHTSHFVVICCLKEETHMALLHSKDISHEYRKRLSLGIPNPRTAMGNRIDNTPKGPSSLD
jgi:hypothetical protein